MGDGGRQRRAVPLQEQNVPGRFSQVPWPLGNHLPTAERVVFHMRRNSKPRRRAQACRRGRFSVGDSSCGRASTLTNRAKSTPETLAHRLCPCVTVGSCPEFPTVVVSPAATRDWRPGPNAGRWACHQHQRVAGGWRQPGLTNAPSAAGTRSAAAMTGIAASEHLCRAGVPGAHAVAAATLRSSCRPVCRGPSLV